MTRITTGATEPIAIFVVNAAGNPLTGLSDLYVRIRRVSNGDFLDWSDMTFKASGWTTLNKILTEASATNAPGVYGVTGGLNTGAITNAAANDDYQVIPLQTPGVTARLPSPGVIQVGKWVDYVDAAVSTRSTQAQILSDATPFPGARIDAAITTRATQAQILSDATPFQGARIDAAISSRATQAQIISDATPFAGASIAAIKAKTDNLPVDPADESNQLAQHTATQNAISALNNLSQAGVQSAMTAQGYTAARAPNLDALDAAISTRATQAQILNDATPFSGASIAAIKAKTDNLPVDPASETNVNANETKIDALQGNVTDILADTAAIDARLPTDPADESLQQAAHAQTQADIAALNDLSQADVQAAMTAQGYTAARGPKLDALDANVSTRATQAQILSDATPFAGADVGLIKTAAQAVDARLPADPADESNTQLAIGSVQSDVTAILADTSAIDARLPPDPADESLQQAAHTQTQADIAALNNLSSLQVENAVWDATQASHVAAGTTGESMDNAGSAGVPPTVGAIADAVWDEALSAHAIPGSTGEALDAADATADPAAVAVAVWDEALAGHVTAGTTGEAQNRLAGIQAQTDLLPVDPASETNVDAVKNKVDALQGDATAILADTAAIDARLPADPADESLQQAAHTQTQADIAALNDLSALQVENAVWDATAASHMGVGTTGESLDAAGATADPGAIADAVWDEALAAHTAPGSAGEAEGRLDALISSRAAPGANMGLVANAVDATTLAAAGANKVRDAILSDSTPFAGAQIDAPVSSRAEPGDAMDLVNGAIDGVVAGVWDEPKAAHATPGTMGEALDEAAQALTAANKIDGEATADPATAAPGSLLDRLCNKDGAQTYSQPTDSLQGIRDRLG